MMLRAGLGTADMEYPLVDVQNALGGGLEAVFYQESLPYSKHASPARPAKKQASEDGVRKEPSGEEEGRISRR
jgi:hypothetical protein